MSKTAKRNKKNKGKKKILVVSGTRSEYGLLRPVIKAIHRHKNLSLQIVVTGSHLDKLFGKSINEIRKNGIKISEEIRLPLRDDSNEGMSRVLGEAVLKFTDAFKKLKPSIVVVLGDRVEIFGAGLAAFYMNIPLCQIHAGDKSIGGHLDDSARHAISKLASLQFAASKESAQRLIKMGEEKWRVHNVGAPGLDSILNRKFMSKKKLFKKLKLKDKKTILVLFHSITTEAKESVKGIESILSALKDLDKDKKDIQIVVIFPNADAGGRRIIKKIKDYAKKYDNIKAFKNLDHDVFLNLMKHSELMIGNSSSGIIEAPSFKLPVINVGKRQAGRERANNIIDVGYKDKEIRNAINKALFNNNFRQKVKRCRNPYGEGKAGAKIARVLSRLKIGKKLIQKKITY